MWRALRRSRHGRGRRTPVAGRWASTLGEGNVACSDFWPDRPCLPHVDVLPHLRGAGLALGQKLLPRRQGRDPGWQDAAVLRRPDQGQDLRHQLPVHVLQRRLPPGNVAACRAAGQAGRQHGSRHLLLFDQHRPGDGYARTAQGLCKRLPGRARLAVLDRQAGGHPCHPPQAGRAQPGSERPSQRGSARQRGHGRVGPQLRARRSR